MFMYEVVREEKNASWCYIALATSTEVISGYIHCSVGYTQFNGNRS